MARFSAAITSLFFFLFRGQMQDFCWVKHCTTFPCKVPMVCGDFPEKDPNAPSPLKVVLASVGQTATTSVSLATQLMGFKTYHIEEKFVYSHRMMWDEDEHHEFRRAVAGCRVEALALEPPTDSLPLCLATNSSVKVIMSWRDYPSWDISRLTLNADPVWLNKHDRFLRVFHELAAKSFLCPWGFIYDSFTLDVTRNMMMGETMLDPKDITVVKYLLQRMLGKFNTEEDEAYFRGNYKVDGEEAYLAHLNEIRVSVPPGQLLEFNPRKHGWAEFEAFLGRPAPKDRPFPHPRSKNSWTNDHVFDNRIDVGTRAVLLFLCLHIVNYCLVHFLVCLALSPLWAAWALLKACWRRLLSGAEKESS